MECSTGFVCYTEAAAIDERDRRVVGISDEWEALSVLVCQCERCHFWHVKKTERVVPNGAVQLFD